jgi:hypothetical protein
VLALSEKQREKRVTELA